MLPAEIPGWKGFAVPTPTVTLCSPLHSWASSFPPVTVVTWMALPSTRDVRVWHGQLFLPGRNIFPVPHKDFIYLLFFLRLTHTEVGLLSMGQPPQYLSHPNFIFMRGTEEGQSQGLSGRAGRHSSQLRAAPSVRNSCGGSCSEMESYNEMVNEDAGACFVQKHCLSP